MTVPVEPIYIGEKAVHCKFFTNARNPGDPSRIEGTFTVVGSEAVLTLDALIGPQGTPGQPSPIIRPQWGSSVTNAANLPALNTLEDSDNGRAWYIDGQWHVYSEGAWHVIQGSIPGPPGITPDISVTAEVIEAEGSVYGPIEVIPTGTSTAHNFHLKIPGVQGPEGPAASIGSASDFNDSGAEVGQFVGVVTQDPVTYGLLRPAVLYPKTWTIPESNFINYNGSQGRFLIASLNIPAQDFEWYPDVAGHVRIRRSDVFSSAQVEVEVRIGDTGLSSTGEASPLCGLAPYDPTTALLDSVTIAHILPHFSNATDLIRSISPDTSVGRVLVGEAKTIYVFIHKLGGTGNYEFTKTGAQLRLNMMPVTAGTGSGSWPAVIDGGTV